MHEMSSDWHNLVNLTTNKAETCHVAPFIFKDIKDYKKYREVAVPNICQALNRLKLNRKTLR